MFLFEFYVKILLLIKGFEFMATGTGMRVDMWENFYNASVTALESDVSPRSSGSAKGSLRRNPLTTLTIVRESSTVFNVSSFCVAQEDRAGNSSLTQAEWLSFAPLGIEGSLRGNEFADDLKSKKQSKIKEIFERGVEKLRKNSSKRPSGELNRYATMTPLALSMEKTSSDEAVSESLVVGGVFIDLECTVDLLEQNKAGELVGESER